MSAGEMMVGVGYHGWLPLAGCPLAPALPGCIHDLDVGIGREGMGAVLDAFVLADCVSDAVSLSVGVVVDGIVGWYRVTVRKFSLKVC